MPRWIFSSLILDQSDVLLVQNEPTWNILFGKVCVIMSINSYSDAATNTEALFSIKLGKKLTAKFSSTLTFQMKHNSTILTKITSKII